jgi:hypothetical protein
LSTAFVGFPLPDILYLTIFFGSLDSCFFSISISDSLTFDSLLSSSVAKDTSSEVVFTFSSWGKLECLEQIMAGNA